MEITSAEFKKGIIGSDPILEDGIPQVAFVGRSNVGKSSVINSLVLRKALVKSSSSPGKTTEINFFLVNGEVYFVDLPGYGYARLGEKKREKLRKMILWYLGVAKKRGGKTVLILDAKVGLTEFDKQMVQVLDDADQRTIIVVNKFDKIKMSEKVTRTRQLEKELEGYTFILYSAKVKTGREELLDKIF